MRNLTLDIFTSSVEDQELSEYKVLAALKKYSDKLHKNLLYPSFGELIELWNMLHSLINQRKYLFNSKTHKISGTDFTDEKPLYEAETEEYDDYSLSKLFDFITWATPKIKEVINEATAIFDFVESELSIEPVGIVPFYANEGYFSIPENGEGTIHVYRFKITNVFDSDVPFSTITTEHIERIPISKFDFKADEFRIELTKKYPDLPSPAVYNICTTLDMPFNETILPVAKRKITRLLAA